MKLLDALLSPTEPEIQRYDVTWYLQQLQQFGAPLDPLGYRTSWGNEPAEPVGDNFIDYVHQLYRTSGVVYACQAVRGRVFSEARFQFQRLSGGRPGELFGTDALSILERPSPGHTTGDLLSRMILDVDLAGNWFGAVIDDEVVRLRPDWTDIILEPRYGPNGGLVGMKRVGYVYYEGGKDMTASGLYTKSGSTPEPFLVGEVAHFIDQPDPMASYRGMTWLTPVVREIQADVQATKHKLKFFENAATPNLAVSLPQPMTKEQFGDFIEMMNAQHQGAEQAYKTLFTAGGADVTVIGADMRQLDFKVTQGAGETRIANAAGVHPAVVGLSEGMQGASLNAGNFQAAKRATAQITLRPLWRKAAGSLELLVPPPGPATRLWYDDRDIEFLREDEKDAAEIRSRDAATIRQLSDAGAKWDAIVEYVASGEVTRLRGQHSGLFSVQLQPPGVQAPEPVPAISSNGSSGG
ncbi:MAG TPA: phage portal protein [Jiangellaceae bacterium]|nr:phage portal protein [Jiangellaceae bacterium]